jgi:hypothetical protein
MTTTPKNSKRDASGSRTGAIKPIKGLRSIVPISFR